MNARMHEMLQEYVLGRCSEVDDAEVTAALAPTPELRRELRELRETIALSQNVGEARPRPEARAKLLSSLQGPERRFAFVGDLMRLFDLGAERVRELLRAIDDPASWEPGPLQGIFVMHFAGGPNALAPDTGFVRLAAGLKFPVHRHLGPEVNYVLEGALLNGDGTLYLPGEAAALNKGTVHDFSIPDGSDTLLAVAQVGFELV
jgi:hypothetical protein